MPRVLALLALVIALAACGASPPAASPGTGIQGVVESSPTCPVERINSPCPPRPLAATVVVSNGQGGEVTRFRSGADGTFKVDLVPGRYTLLGQPIGNSLLPRAIPATATVVQGRYVTVKVEYDSGIR